MELSVIWCSFLIVNIQLLVQKVDASITWTVPSPPRSPIRTDSIRTTEKGFDRSRLAIQLEWRFTLSDDKLSRVSWLLNGEVIGIKRSIGGVTVFERYKNDFNISGRDQATLINYNLTVVDGETFNCEVETEKGRRWNDRIKVIIYVPAKITEIRGEQTVYEGASLQLTCEASGKPEVNITWTKEKTGIQGHTGVLQVGKVLNISTVSKNDSGTYLCTAYHGFGDADIRAVHVNVTYPPKIVEFKTEYFFGVQQSVTLNCEAEGNPPPTYTWIPCDPEQVCNKNTLQISQVLRDTNYTCRVANVYGNDSKTVNVYIGGIVINITIVNTSEICTDGKYEQSLLLEKFKEPLKKAFADKPGYDGVQLKCVRCESRIVDLSLQFNSNTKEKDVIVTLNDIVKDGKLGEFSVGAIKGERPDVKRICGVAATPNNTKSSRKMKAWKIVVIVFTVGIVLGIVIGNICCLCFEKPICCLVFIASLWAIINPCNLCKKNKNGSKEVHSNARQDTEMEAGYDSDNSQYAAAGPNANYRTSNPSSVPSVTYEVANRSSEGRRGNRAGAPREPLPEYAVVDKTKKKKKTPKPGELQYAELGELTGRGQKATMPRVSGTDTVYADIKS